MDLVGRSELIGDVVDVLTSAEMRQVVVLRGDAGAGKTVTALAIANELRALIPAQLMVSGSSQAAFSSALANFATEHVLGLEDAMNTLATFEHGEIVDLEDGSADPRHLGLVLLYCPYMPTHLCLL